MNYNPTDPRNIAAAAQLSATTRDLVPRLVACVSDMLDHGDRDSVLGLLTVHLSTEMHHSAVAGVAAETLIRLAELGHASDDDDDAEGARLLASHAAWLDATRMPLTRRGHDPGE